MHVDLKPSNADELDMDSMVVNSSKPFFSIIIPVYNKEKVVLRSIESALNQSYVDYEIIVVLDPSSDKSSEIVRSLTDPRIRVFERDSPGPGGYAARNLGIKMAEGQWVVFLDADDEWFDFSLAEHYRLIQESGEKIVCTSWQEHDETGLITVHRPVTERLLSGADFFEAYSVEERLVNTNTIAVKKELFDAVGGFPEKKYSRGGDVATWIRLAYASFSVMCSTIETAIYHREDSTVTKSIAPSISDNAIYNVCAEITASRNCEKAVRRSLYKLSNRHIRYGVAYQAKLGQLRLSDLKYFRFSVSPIEYSLFLLLALLPSKVAGCFAQFVLWLKRAFRVKMDFQK
tara:strand:- start:3906 stop:4940 length:1035 start_codon:yes stop_codon:yes gene_type:complete